jgi:hypothetical protein
MGETGRCLPVNTELRLGRRGERFRLGVSRVRGRGGSVRSLGGLVLHALFERAKAFADPFAKLGQFLWPKNEQGYAENDQQMRRLKQAFHRNLPGNVLRKPYLSHGIESTDPLGRWASYLPKTGLKPPPPPGGEALSERPTRP